MIHHEFPKKNYDISWNIDIPNKGRIKMLIYMYSDKDKDNFFNLALLSAIRFQKELIILRMKKIEMFLKFILYGLCKLILNNERK